MWELVEHAFSGLSKDLVDAFFASTASAASTRFRRGTICRIDIDELGHFDGSALEAQHVQCLSEACAPSKRSVEQSSGKSRPERRTRAMPRHGRSRPEGAPVDGR